MTEALTERQLKIIQWLTVEASDGLAALFARALSLMQADGDLATVPLVSHCVREIANRLPQAIGATTISGHTDYADFLNEMEEDLERAFQDYERESLLPTTDQTKVQGVPLRLESPTVSGLRDMLNSHKAGVGRNQRKGESLFAAINGTQEESQNEIQIAVKSWLSVKEFFVSRAHLTESGSLREPNAEFSNQFNLFEDFLFSMSQTFFEGMDEIDALLETANRR